MCTRPKPPELLGPALLVMQTAANPYACFITAATATTITAHNALAEKQMWSSRLRAGGRRLASHHNPPHLHSEVCQL